MRSGRIGPFKVNTECRHPEHRYAIAHADLVYDPGDGGEAYIQEAKTSGAHASRRGRDADYGYGSEDDGAEGIPAAVYLQVQWQLLVYGARKVEEARGKWELVLLAHEQTVKDLKAKDAEIARLKEQVETLREALDDVAEISSMPNAKGLRNAAIYDIARDALDSTAE